MSTREIGPSLAVTRRRIMSRSDPGGIRGTRTRIRTGEIGIETGRVTDLKDIEGILIAESALRKSQTSVKKNER
jgi:hypothetical protein